VLHRSTVLGTHKVAGQTRPQQGDRVKKPLFAVVVALATALLLAPVASAIDKVNTRELRRAVTVGGILEHEQALQNIATANGGIRAATFPGYDASVEYVAKRLRRAGYKVTLDAFDFAHWEKNGPSTLERISPSPTVWVEDTDYIVSQFSAAGDVEAPVFVAGNTEIPPSGGAGTSVSGCDPDDFNGMPAGAIALIQRGTCPFVQKYQNAQDKGAGAALIFNDGFTDREDPLFITAPQDMSIPAAMISNDVGEEIVGQTQSGPVTLHIVVDATTTPITQYNVIGDSRSGDPKRTIVLGSHLDSVEAGPGINDNGSGSSMDLEIAEQVAKLGQKPKNRLRFAFWGAEEAGLVGSTDYVEELVGNGTIKQIEANLNFDMVGSPNFVRFVYDGDLSDSAPPPSGAPNGSGQIEGLFNSYFDSQGLAHDPTAFDGRSDYGPFIANGVPAGGLFSGAEGIKTAEQAAVYGGTAGAPYDSCYHQACDTIANLNNTALDQFSDAAAHAAWTLARSKSPVTKAQKAKAAKKSRKAGRTRGLKYQGPFRVR
jgi:Zn-dependent M28 family amino/carboxypeptidase